MSKLDGEKRRQNSGVKTIVGSVIGLLLAAGLCAAGRVQDSSYHDGAPGLFDTLGGVLFLLSAVGLLIGVVIAIVEAVDDRGKR